MLAFFFMEMTLSLFEYGYLHTSIFSLPLSTYLSRTGETEARGQINTIDSPS